jgi:hypothetical protein
MANSNKNSPEGVAETTAAHPTVEARMGLCGTFSKSNPNSPIPDLGPNVRILPGASRRPMSVDAKANKRASRTRIEQGELDYTAYI